MWFGRECTFLRYELSEGRASLSKYLEEKRRVLGQMDSMKALERVIGVLSYARHNIRDMVALLWPLQDELAHFKVHGAGEEDWERVTQKAEEAMERALS